MKVQKYPLNYMDFPLKQMVLITLPRSAVGISFMYLNQNPKRGFIIALEISFLLIYNFMLIDQETPSKFGSSFQSGYDFLRRNLPQRLQLHDHRVQARQNGDRRRLPGYSKCVLHKVSK